MQCSEYSSGHTILVSSFDCMVCGKSEPQNDSMVCGAVDVTLGDCNAGDRRSRDLRVRDFSVACFLTKDCVHSVDHLARMLIH